MAKVPQGRSLANELIEKRHEAAEYHIPISVTQKYR